MPDLDNRTKDRILYDSPELLNNIVERLDQKHPLDRKIQFFLDIRGLLKVNNMVGSYVEYGCFLGETVYSAKSILGSNLNHYYGIDLFDVPQKSDEDLNNTFDTDNPFTFESFDLSDNFFSNQPDVSIIKGDLRDPQTFNSLPKNDLVVALVDCNFNDSLQSSIDHAVKNLKSGGLLFVDDYFTNLENGVHVVERMLSNSLANNGKKRVFFNTYPPFAQAYLIFDE